MNTILKQSVGYFRATIVCILIALVIAPFIMNQMGISGVIAEKLGTMPGVLLYVIGSIGLINLIEQSWRVLFSKSSENILPEIRRRRRNFVLFLVAITVLSISALGVLVFK